MRVKLCKVEFSGDQEQHRSHGGKAHEPSRLAFGGLEQAIDRFDKSVRLARLRPSDDAIKVTANHESNFLHRFDLGAHYVGTPLG